MHRSQTWDRDGVEPGKDVGGEELVDTHAHKAVPEVPNRFGAFNALPMESLEGLYSGESTPVDCLDVPDGDGTHHTANAVSKEPDRYDAQDDSGGLQRQVIEDILRREDLDASSSVGSRCRGDGANRVFLQVPVSMVEE